MKLSRDNWRSIAKSLQIIGFAWYIVFFVSSFALLVYYAVNRPSVPRPERGLSVPLRWTHPVRYGAEQDEKRSERLFNLAFLGAGLFAVGEMITVYKLGDHSHWRPRPNPPPWDHKWGP